MESRRLAQDDDAYNISETQQLLNTFYINLTIFGSLMILFELLRHWKSIFLVRLKRKFISENRVPEKPSIYPFAWIWTIMNISHDEVLRMIGLDGYMLLRYLNACVRIAAFCAFWGLIVMVPVYANGSGGLTGWNQYTLANIPDDPHSSSLWVPVIFCYFFSIFYCQLMYFEYKNYIRKRVSFLEDGDADTPVQTYYTVMLEKIPSSLRSNQILRDFFDRLFPGDVYTAEIALDLNQLDELVEHRKKIRNQLEKAIALWKAKGKRPTMLVDPKLYNDIPNKPLPLPGFTIFSYCGYERYDSIEHLSKLLEILNENVRKMQSTFYEQRQRVDEIESNRLQEIKKVLAGSTGIENASKQVRKIAGNIKSHTSRVINHTTNVTSQLILPTAMRRGTRRSRSPTLQDEEDEKDNDMSNNNSFASQGRLSSKEGDVFDPNNGANNGSVGSPSLDSNATALTANKQKGLLETGSSRAQQVINIGAKIVGSGVEGLAKEGLKTAEFATRGALRGVYEATRALELLTLGAYYRTSSTAFITFKTRFSSCCCQQMLLSHEHYMIDVTPAPNPNDIIWSNVSIPLKQINIRKSISNSTLIVGALFWSIVVTFITAVSNLESISQEIPSLQAYSNTSIYQFFNNYLAVLILLILLALLPFVFDFISRNYEGVKLESEIQNSIMTRYFYYQLANVFVSVGLGSIANSLHQILEDPTSILSILGNSVPSFSIYFANLLITRAFTGIPIEMLRIFPLLDIVIVMFCADKKRYTRRELSSGAFADPPMLYGWIYPNILMGVMIMVTYFCIAPFILVFCVAFFSLLYLMYKYQLLYVYINSYQSGGYMWYAVFDASMLALLCGVITLVCYLAIRETFVSGPFYALLPLPVLISYFWHHCNTAFKKPASTLSLERAKDMDEILKQSGVDVTVNGEFDTNLFRQPSLTEGDLHPAVYRTSSISTELKDLGLGLSLASVESHERPTVADDFIKDEEAERDIDALLEEHHGPKRSKDKKNDDADEENGKGGQNNTSDHSDLIRDKESPSYVIYTEHSPIIAAASGSTAPSNGNLGVNQSVESSSVVYGSIP